MIIEYVVWEIWCIESHYGEQINLNAPVVFQHEKKRKQEELVVATVFLILIAWFSTLKRNRKGNDAESALLNTLQQQ